ncbi:MAG: serine/threonine-protein kinase [Cyanobacteria bacterium J06641_5]
MLKQRYEIVREIGRGGFGRTFLGIDNCVTPGRQCAIKKLQPLLTGSEQFQTGSEQFQQVYERFQREAAALAQLSQDCRQIPHFYDRFSEGGHFYLVQEWIEGITLAEQVCRDGPLTPEAVTQLLCDLLPVLASIHHNRAIHRDIKPDNIILRSSDGLPVLIDFGAVKEVMGPTEERSQPPTKTVVVGTPSYMAPEQAVGRPVYTSDLYSLAMTAIYLLTGRSPQELPDDSKTGEILWRQSLPTLRGPLATAIDKALRFHPRDRFADAEEMLHTLSGGSRRLLLPLPPVSSLAGVSNLDLSALTETASRVLSQPGRNKRPLFLAAVTVTVMAIGIGVAGFRFTTMQLLGLPETSAPTQEDSTPAIPARALPDPQDFLDPFPSEEPEEVDIIAIAPEPEEPELPPLPPEPIVAPPVALPAPVPPPIPVPPPVPQAIALAPSAFGRDLKAQLGNPSRERNVGPRGLFANTRELRYDNAIEGQGDWVFYTDLNTQQVRHIQARVRLDTRGELTQSLLDRMVGAPVNAATYDALRQVQSGAANVRSFQTATLAGTIIRQGNELILNVSQK